MAMIRTYTETFDMNTEQDCPTLLGVHVPTGTTMYRFLAPCFKMYRKYKYLGADVTIVNAARLPVDPEQLGKIDGENYIDPRDTLNPIMFKGCHGESLGAVLDSMYNGLLMDNRGSSLDREVFKSALKNFYYTALGDDGWRKSPIQKTLNIKGLHPLVYSLSTNHQILPSGAVEAGSYPEDHPSTVANPNTAGTAGHFIESLSGGYSTPGIPPTFSYGADGSANGYIGGGQGSMFTSRMHRLGWLDTLQFVGNRNSLDTAAGSNIYKIAELPKLFMGLLMLPPANLCRQYLRVIIRHRIKFAAFRTITTGAIDPGEWNPENTTYGYYNDMTGNVPSGSKDEDLDREKVEGDEIDE